MGDMAHRFRGFLIFLQLFVFIPRSANCDIVKVCEANNDCLRGASYLQVAASGPVFSRQQHKDDSGTRDAVELVASAGSNITTPIVARASAKHYMAPWLVEYLSRNVSFVQFLSEQNAQSKFTKSQAASIGVLSILIVLVAGIFFGTKADRANTSNAVRRHSRDISRDVVLLEDWRESFVQDGHTRKVGSKEIASTLPVLPELPIVEDPDPVDPVSLCPGLVVPSGSECHLVMAIPDEITSIFFVMDVDGKPVLRCEISRPDWNMLERQVVAQLRPALPTLEFAQETVLARCEIDVRQPGGGGRSVFVYDEEDVLFACVKKDTQNDWGGSYVLSVEEGRAPKGFHLKFGGSFTNHAITVQNENNETLAETEAYDSGFQPKLPHMKIHVSAGVDVGVILCGLLCIGAIECR